jgi:hypothetical protein
MPDEENLELTGRINEDQAEKDEETSASSVIEGGGLDAGIGTVAAQVGEVAVEMVGEVVVAIVDGLLDN